MPHEDGKRIYRKNARALADIIAPVTKPVFRQHGIAEMQLIRDWEHIVGSSLAAHTVPFQLQWPKGKSAEGTLIVHVSGGFATELQHMETQVLERIATHFGYRAVSRLKILQTSLESPQELRSSAPPLPQPKRQSETENEDPLAIALARLGDALQTKKT